METGKWLCLGALGALTLCVAVLCDDVIEAQEGSNAEFKCNYASTFQNPRVEWKFNSGPDTSFVYYAGKLTDAYKDRADIYPMGLRLRGVTRKDNGYYVCEVAGTDSAGNPVYADIKSHLVVLVPPSVPVAQVPISVTTGSVAQLVCYEKDSSPPATFVWYKNQVSMPPNAAGSPTFQNSSYTIDAATGVLKFSPVTKMDAGDYSCQATNSQGSQTSAAVRMEVHDVNVGGIVAAVIIVLLILGVIAFGLWYAYSRGYIGKKSNKKVIYSQPSETRSDKNFQQTSSFLV